MCTYRWQMLFKKWTRVWHFYKKIRWQPHPQKSFERNLIRKRIIFVPTLMSVRIFDRSRWRRNDVVDGVDDDVDDDKNDATTATATTMMMMTTSFQEDVFFSQKMLLLRIVFGGSRNSHHLSSAAKSSTTSLGGCVADCLTIPRSNLNLRLVFFLHCIIFLSAQATNWLSELFPKGQWWWRARLRTWRSRVRFPETHWIFHFQLCATYLGFFFSHLFLSYLLYISFPVQFARHTPIFFLLLLSLELLCKLCKRHKCSLFSVSVHYHSLSLLGPSYQDKTGAARLQWRQKKIRYLKWEIHFRDSSSTMSSSSLTRWRW